MRALVVHSPGIIGLEQVSIPTVLEGQVLIRPIANGLCGTDLDLIDGTNDEAFVRYPLTLGHEWVGRSYHGVNGELAAGERVAVEGIHRLR